MDFRVLGAVEVCRDGVLQELRGERLGSLLSVLIVHAGEVVSAERLVTELWGEDAPRSAGNTLQAHVSRLRRALGEPDRVVTRGRGYSLRADDEEIDARRFEAWVAQARRAAASGTWDEALAAVEHALALWRGPAFADALVADAVRREATRLEEIRLTALEDRFAWMLELGRHAQVTSELEAEVDRNPLRERLTALWMTALARSGRQADALRAFQALRERLVEDLGLEPGPEVRAVEAAVLAQDPSVVAAPTPVVTVPAAPRERPAPEPARPEPSPPARTNLAPELTSFVGRAAEVEELHRALDTSRLVTLVGPGGAGKTRLAFETARARLDRHADGVWAVELASVTDPNGVAVAAAMALSVPLSPDLRDAPVGGAMVARVIDHLADRETLLVLDNCEHVIAPAAGLVDAVLRGCPRVTILATSREGLGIPGEHLIPVPPLALDEAVELFRVRALAAGAPAESCDEDLVREICARLDGMPLAVELAAARARAFPLAELAARLDDRFRLLTGGSRLALPRQQTLRAVVDWSYELLTEPERAVFARLSAFSGGCRLEAAEEICSGDGVERADVLDLIGRLVDKSLVSVVREASGTRYRLLQTLWHYGHERLAESGDAARVRNRHAAYYRQWLGDAERAVTSPQQARWLAAMRAELDNLWSALIWAVEAGDGDTALSIAANAGYYFLLSGQSADGYRWVKEALSVRDWTDVEARAVALSWSAYFGCHSGIELDVDVEASLAAARALIDELLAAAHPRAHQVESLHLLGSAQLWVYFGRHEAAEAALARLDEIQEHVQNPWYRGVASIVAGSLAMSRGQLDHSERCYRAAVDLLTSAGDVWGAALALMELAVVAEARGRYAEADAALAEMAARSAEAGIEGWSAVGIASRGNLATLEGRFEDAERFYAQAYALASELKVNFSVAAVMTSRAFGRRRQGRLDDAEAELRAVLARLGLGTFLGLRAFVHASLGFLAELRGDLDSARDEHLRSLDLASRTRDPRAVALALEGLAGVEAAGGDARWGGWLLGLAAGLRRRSGAPLPPAERVDVDRAEARLRERLGEEGLRTALDEGAELVPEDVVGKLLAERS